MDGKNKASQSSTERLNVKSFILTFFIFSFILLISGLAYFIAKRHNLLDESSSEFNQTSPSFTEETGEGQTMSADLSALPTRYWSEFTQQLMRVEEERIVITDTLSQRFPPIDTQFFEPPDSTVAETSPTKALSPPLNAKRAETPEKFMSYISSLDEPVFWASVGGQILRLEQQRQQVIDVLIRRMSTGTQKGKRFNIEPSHKIYLGEM